MDKIFDEEEIKGLEAEIEAAVDRLFVEKKEERKSRPIVEAPRGEFLLGKEDGLPLKSLENLESQLLSLEWEVSKENLRKSIMEVEKLQSSFKENPETSSILSRMANLLHHMIENEERIEASLIKILLDSKETLKLLIRKDKGEFEVYKRLAYAGIEARFNLLEEISTQKIKRQVKNLTEKPFADSWMEEVTRRMDFFLQRLDEILQKMDRHLESHEKAKELSIREFQEKKPSSVKVTILKVGENLIGVESEKVFKLFKIPEPMLNRLVQLPKIRIQGFEVKMIPLKNILPIEEWGEAGEKQILMVREDGGFKGLVIDRIVNKLLVPIEKLGNTPLEGSLLGRIQWIYRDRPEEVPILDLSKC